MADNDNMKIWAQVCYTDPKHTKAVEFGRKFTSIDAHYQVMRATEVFGPVGDGWTYNCAYGQETAGTIPYVWCDMMIHWGRKDDDSSDDPFDNCMGRFDHVFGPIRCTCPMLDNKGRLDKDAPKKAMTDCLTKGLSHLGFNADVFLGRFDDNAYVQMMKEKFEESVPEIITEYKRRTEAAKTHEELQAVNAELGPKMAEMKTTHASHVTKAAAAWSARKRLLMPATTEKE